MTPSASEVDPEQLIGQMLAALNDRDAGRLERLLDPGVVIRTGKAAHEGREAALEWAQKTYDHLDRRWVVDQLLQVPGGWVGVGRVQYVWREEGEVGDSSPTALSIEVEAGRVRSIGIHDDETEARGALATAS